MRNQYFALNLQVFMLAVLCSGVANADEIVYQKTFAKRQSLLISRHQVPYVPPTYSPPGFTAAVPEKSYVYTFSILSGNREQVWWTRRHNAYDIGGHQISRLMIYDTLLEGNTLVIIHEDSCFGSVYANIICHTAKSPVEEMPLTDILLTRENDLKPIVIQGATLSGSLKDNTLSATLKNLGTEPFHFRYIEKMWVRDPSDLQSKNSLTHPPANFGIGTASNFALEPIWRYLYFLDCH